MGTTIREKADRIGTFRYLSVYWMETLASWVPTTPELEVKALFGRHLWELAQHADSFGQRTAELRAPLHYHRPPVEQYLAVLRSVAETADTAARIRSFYDAVVPDLRRRYAAYLDETDALLDEPSIRILERVLTDLDRLQADCRVLCGERPELSDGDDGSAASVAAALQATADCVDYRPAPAQVGEG